MQRNIPHWSEKTARELVVKVRKDVSIDWTVRENVGAQLLVSSKTHSAAAHPIGRGFDPLAAPFPHVAGMSPVRTEAFRQLPRPGDSPPGYRPVFRGRFVGAAFLVAGFFCG